MGVAQLILQLTAEALVDPIMVCMLRMEVLFLQKMVILQLLPLEAELLRELVIMEFILLAQVLLLKQQVRAIYWLRELAEMLRVLVVAIMGFMYQMQMGCKLLALETLLLSALVGILPEAVQIIMAFIHILLEPASRPVLIAILILQLLVEELALEQTDMEFMCLLIAQLKPRDQAI